METWGSAADTLVFLPGLGCRPRYYRTGIELLARRFRIVVPDLSFPSHPRLPSGPADYLALVSDLADDLAPGAVWSGHSFGALLALLRPGPAIACAPSIPADVPMWRTAARAVWLQLREYVGLAGRRGPGYAARIMVDYVSTAVARPHALFPAVESLKRPPRELPIRSERALVYLCATDELYRRSEYERYFDVCGHEGVVIEELAHGHDWPILRPDRFADRVERAWERLAAA